MLGLALPGCAAFTDHQPPAVSTPVEGSQSPATIVAAHPAAAQAGLDVLKSGGDAIDAAIAVQAVLGLVEPQSSGIGGGAFMLYHDAETGKTTSYNGREKAPAQASEDMLLDETGKPLPRSRAMLGGRATGVPGVLAMLELAHGKHGKLAWAAPFAPAIEMADAGFPLTGRTARYVGGQYPQSDAPDVRAEFRSGKGRLLTEGEQYRNPAYAQTLRLIASQGATAFYESDRIAGAIVERTREAPLAGAMTRDDMRTYEAQFGEPLCRPYRAYLVCVPPPPSSGVALLQVLGILEGTPIAGLGPEDPDAWFLFIEASRLAYADRDRYVGDPDFVEIPISRMLDPDYLDRRRSMIGASKMPAPEAGELAQDMPGKDATSEPAGTSHFVIVDADGDVVSMTTTIESYFGSGRTVGGFFLNNQMTDFSFSPVDDGRPAANAVAGGKRPRSSMTPTIVLDSDGKVVAALGSPGGNAIIAYVAKALVGMLDWGLSPADAIALPNIVARGDAVRGEGQELSEAVRVGLERRGITVVPGSGEESGLHAVLLHEGRLIGGADPRRDGSVATDGAETAR